MSDYITTSNGDRVAFDRYDAGDSGDVPAVVFVAGAGPHRATDPITTPTAERVARQGVTTVVYDRLGRGESPADGRVGLDRELAVIAALVAAAGGRAVLCGHSSGCWISLAAAQAGLPMEGLLLWEPPLGPPEETRAWIREVERRMDAGELEPALEHYMKDMPPQWLEGARRSPGFADAVAQVPSLRADGESLVWAVSRPLTELLHTVRVPIEVVAGEQTFDEMIRSSAAIVAAAPNATETRLPGANHAWEPEAMAAELVRFARLAGRRG